MPPTAPIPVRAGLTAPERAGLRERVADWYADHGHDEDTGLRAYVSPSCAAGGPPGECAWEQPGGRGCLAETHDGPHPPARGGGPGRGAH